MQTQNIYMSSITKSSGANLMNYFIKEVRLKFGLSEVFTIF